jgi:hypothetical protein
LAGILLRFAGLTARVSGVAVGRLALVIAILFVLLVLVIWRIRLTAGRSRLIIAGAVVLVVARLAFASPIFLLAGLALTGLAFAAIAATLFAWSGLLLAIACASLLVWLAGLSPCAGLRVVYGVATGRADDP